MKSIPFIFALMLASSAFAGSLYTEDSLWQKRGISVCFAGGEKDKRELEAGSLRISNWSGGNKKDVEKWVSEEYSMERTGVSFSGWKNCADSPHADVVIFYGKKSVGEWLLDGHRGAVTRGASTIGPQTYLDLEGYPNAHSYVWLYSDGLTKATVVHEFGHSLGLHHEHYRFEAFKDPKCKNEEDAGLGPSFAKARVFGEYDSDSIMSYCTIHQKNGSKLGLSAGDVKILKFLYP